jgi:hypothetical protein
MYCPSQGAGKLMPLLTATQDGCIDRWGVSLPASWSGGSFTGRFFEHGDIGDNGDKCHSTRAPCLQHLDSGQGVFVEMLAQVDFAEAALA